MKYASARDKESLRELVGRTFQLDTRANPKEYELLENEFRSLNPDVTDWDSLAEGTLIQLPTAESNGSGGESISEQPAPTQFHLDLAIGALEKSKQRYLKAVDNGVAEAKATIEFRKSKTIQAALKDNADLKKEADAAAGRAEETLKSAADESKRYAQMFDWADQTLRDLMG
jgi:hypothetical protein